MGPAKILTPEEEARCVHFLRLLNITSPTDRFLSDRGFFSLFLSGLHPDEVGEDVHPDQREFREIIRLLSLAGVEQIRSILERREKLRQQREEGLRGKTPAPLSGRTPLPINTPLPIRTPLPVTTPPPIRSTSAPRPPTSPLSSLRTPLAVGKPVAPPPTAFASSRKSVATGGGNETPMAPNATPLNATPLNATPPHLTPPPLTPLPFTTPRTGVPVSGTRQTPSGEVNVASVIAPARTHYSKDIHAMKPSDAQIQHQRELQRAASEKEAIDVSNDYLQMGEFQDAYHVLVDYMVAHPLTLTLARALNQIIVQANHYDFEASKPPYNMLYECEEMAALLVKRIPNLRILKESDVSMTEQYQIVKVVYRSWTSHCRALLEYKYHLNAKEWVTRNWVDPREFGFLVEVMRMAIRSMLPLDLLRFIFSEIKQCVEIGSKKVIATEAKRCQFYAETLRIIASPARDVIPDLQFEIYREIVYSYLREGDSANALTFVKQVLTIRKGDKEMQKLKQDLEHK
ncbi:hypothetical protein IT570_03950 [Candidatus Sumerlaeota bacterium]|nr:hypothetical protein [Candidatus Sumerlaeota bacterium]